MVPLINELVLLLCLAFDFCFTLFCDDYIKQRSLIYPVKLRFVFSLDIGKYDLCVPIPVRTQVGVQAQFQQCLHIVNQQLLAPIEVQSFSHMQAQGSGTRVYVPSFTVPDISPGHDLVD